MTLKPGTRPSGFTLIELMVAVALLAILTVAALPSFNELRQRTLLKGAAEQLLSIVANARFEAVKRNQAVRVTFDRDSETDWCIGASVGTAAVCDCRERDTGESDFCELGYYPEATSDLRSLRAAAPTNFDLNIEPALGVLENMATSHSVELTAPTLNYVLQVSVSPLAHGNACVVNTSLPITGYQDC